MKTSLTIYLLLSLAVTQMAARERTYEEKCRIAQEILPRLSETSRAKVSTDIIALKTNEFYTVLGRSNGGFVIISNDNACKPVVGYSQQAIYSEDNPSLNWYLTLAATYIEKEATTSMQTTRSNTTSIPEGCKEKVEHLLNSHWNQDDPYWAKCPTDKRGYRCYTGCVATAMAEIMNYYQYPKTGIGKDTIYFDKQPYSVNFGTAHYDWSNMLASYSGTYNLIEKTAVATLIYHCGVAANMTYSPNGSGASMSDAAKGMSEHFGYITKYYGEKESYNDKAWKTVMYKELSDGHPLLYAGTSNKQGNENVNAHAFVLDGYDTNGYVGVNWGYSGNGDGYFAPDILTLHYKIGSTTVDEDFEWYQEMVVIHHPDAGSINYELSSGISSPAAPLSSEASSLVRIYDTMGRLIYSVSDEAYDINDIPTKGILIVKKNGNAYKVIK